MKIACIGECMVEVAGIADHSGKAHIGFGGDTLNTAIYLARLLNDDDFDIHYITRLGDDPYSDAMIAAWKDEGINCDFVEQIPGREAGLYAINVNDAGERNFNYWRSDAPVRELFEGRGGANLIDHLSSFDMIFFSGITLAVLLSTSQMRLLSLAGRMKEAGRMVAYDTNFRSRLWPGGDASNMNVNALHNTTLLLPSSEDLEAIFGSHDKTWHEFIDEFSIPEVVMKHGGSDIDLFSGGNWQQVKLEKMSNPVDTTAAGDSFNAGFLAAKLQGFAPTDAVLCAHELASAVINYPGAIIPPDAMPENFAKMEASI